MQGPGPWPGPFPKVFGRTSPWPGPSPFCLDRAGPWHGPFLIRLAGPALELKRAVSFGCLGPGSQKRAASISFGKGGARGFIERLKQGHMREVADFKAHMNILQKVQEGSCAAVRTSTKRA